MRSTLSLIRREFTAYFWSPVAYVVLGVFLLALGLLFHLTVQKLTARGPVGTEFPMQDLLGNVGFWLIFWIIPPLLTMRMFAEERSTGTLEMLMTAPLRDGQVVLSKFLACYLFYALLLLPTLLYLPLLLNLHDAHYHPPETPWGFTFVAGLAVLVVGLLWAVVRLGITAFVLVVVGGIATLAGAWGHYVVDPSPHVFEVASGIDPMPLVTSYLGLALAGAMFLALGLWVSSLVRNQLVAALVALALNLVFILGGLLVLGGFVPTPSDTGVFGYRLLAFVSVPLHFSRDFTRGLVDTRHVVLYVSVTLAGLFLTVRSLESRRWR
ncbi:MAG TPA: ABC transporter permease [Gemmataceae bacterium]|jgi:ABC-type transport system involved in multi-copper enzyme maturation permease subunit